MAELQTMARPYARAAFELARDKGTLGAWSEQLGALAAVVSEPGMRTLIGHPSVTRGDLAAAIVAAMGERLSADVDNFVRVLAENRRLPLVPMIAEQFDALKDAHEAVVEVDITTATPVDEAQRQQLGTAIGRRLARDVRIDWNVDEALVAGAIVRAGDLVIDGSVHGELARLKAALAH